MFADALYSLGSAGKFNVEKRLQVHSELQPILKIAQLPGNTEQVVGTV